MGQLEIQMAQQMARENDRNLAFRAQTNRIAAERGFALPVATARKGGWLRGLGERLHLGDARPAHLA